MIEIFRDANLIKVSFYKQALEEEGIKSIIKNESIAMTEIPIPIFYPALCIVNEEDHQKALRILEERIKLEQTESRSPDRDCPQCSEPNPANFQTCWSCSSD